MKALIVDIEGKYAIAMTKKGTFIKVKNTGKYTVGYEADLPPAIFLNAKLMAGIASAAIFLIAVGLGFFFYINPYSYVNIDINPSIEITANIFDRIINVTALNDSAQKIINDLSVKNKALDLGVEQVVSSAVRNGYLQDEKTNAIMLTVTSTNESKNKQLQEKVAEVVENKIKSDKIDSEIVVEEVTEKSRSEAIKQGVSPGKLKLAQQLTELDPKLKTKDVVNKPVKEILKSIRQHTKPEKPDKKDNKNIDNKDKNNNKNSNENKNNDIKESKNNKNNNDASNDKNNKNNKNNNKNPDSHIKKDTEKNADKVKNSTPDNMKPKPNDKDKDKDKTQTNEKKSTKEYKANTNKPAKEANDNVEKKQKTTEKKEPNIKK